MGKYTYEDWKIWDGKKEIGYYIIQKLELKPQMYYQFCNGK